MNTNPTPIPVLALRPREAAEAIGVSERTLWAWTQQGDVPFIRRGKALLYPVAELTAWLSAQVARSPEEEAARLIAWHRENGLECEVFTGSDRVEQTEAAIRHSMEGGGR